jgi:hypothetical protein
VVFLVVQGLSEGATDPQINAVLLSNRSHAHSLLGEAENVVVAASDTCPIPG